MRARLDATSMLDRAQQETRLDDYGDPSLPQRFAMVVEHLNGIGMDADGVRRAAEVCHWLLTSRLQFFEDRRRHPVADEVI
ncbi:sulfotransferase, partial [Mycolicibacterium pulveris]